jgi:hypothetical protein
MLKTLALQSPIIQSDVVKYFQSEIISNTEETLAAGVDADNVVDVGTVLGRITIGPLDATFEPRTGNTGDLANTFGIPKVDAGAKPGIYTITFTDVTKFRVEDPDGIEIGEGTTGVAFTNKLNFTLVAVDTPAVVGDAANITVTAEAGSNKVVPLNLAATDGSQNAYGISQSRARAPVNGADQKILVLRRLGVVVADKLIWPNGMIAAAKTIALRQLEQMLIIARED